MNYKIKNWYLYQNLGPNIFFAEKDLTEASFQKLGLNCTFLKAGIKLTHLNKSGYHPTN